MKNEPTLQNLSDFENKSLLIVDDDKIQWSGPPGVIHLATNSDVQLTY